MGPVKEILDIARRANIALVGVGTVDPEVSRFVQFTALSAEDMNHIANDCGGVGDINAFVFDIEGRPCAQEYADRVIGVSLAEIKNIPFRIGVAATAAKALPHLWRTARRLPACAHYRRDSRTRNSRTL